MRSAFSRLNHSPGIVLGSSLLVISSLVLFLLISFYTAQHSTLPLVKHSDGKDASLVLALHGRHRRSVSHRGSRGVYGVARDCGQRCTLSLRGNDRRIRVHLRRVHTGHDRSYSHFVPIVQFVQSNESFSARGGRVSLDCMYEARVHGGPDISLLNLCEQDDGVLGTLALPEGVFSVEPIKGTSEGKQRDHILTPYHHLPSRLVFDYIGNASSDNSSVDSTPFNLTLFPWEDIHKRKERSRRAANSWDFHVEVLVVADSEMFRYHGENLENYLLTLFSTAGPRVTANAQETLKNFCRWQQLYKGRPGESLTNHDVAILLTRGDICRSPGKCDTLGLAELGTMCDGEKSCAIIEDNGLSAAFTIAHELGHIFNVPHDDERKCAQFMSLHKTSNGSTDMQVDPSNFHIMAPTLEYNTHPWSWSPCSSALLERFLDSNRGQVQCLFNKPTERKYYEALFESDPPGVKYTVDQQCKFVFGPEATVCPYMPACRRLWCSVTYGSQQGCRTQHMPWADGTPCHTSKTNRGEFCHRGECVNMAVDKTFRRDGEWGEWNGWERCSRTCGGGIQKSTRDCNNPSPANGGKYCTGLRERYRSCSVDECPWDTPPFRDVQCAEFNSKETGIYGLQSPVSWVPKYGVSENERCKLYCRVDGSAAFHLLKEKVVDGTPCDTSSDDLCVDGTCVPAGCDRVLHSRTRRDQCGVCGGDGSGCERVKGTYNERGTFGYNQVMKIPAGSANIEVTQHAYHGQKEDDNYLALRSADGTFLLNGNYQVSVYRSQIPLQDSVIEYSGSETIVEKINATGPIRSDIYVHVLSVGNLYPPDIRYEYMVSKRNDIGQSQRHVSHFRWSIDENRWTDCDRKCNGHEHQVIQCLDSHNRRANERSCPVNRPTAHSRMCNVDCKLKWTTEPRSGCSAACGHGIQRMLVTCSKVDLSERVLERVDESLCTDTRPHETRACFSDCNGRRWTYTQWGECTQSCGESGIQRRMAKCLDERNRILDESYCARESREETERECGRTPCPKWVYGMWSECSRSCDGGVRMRHAQCVDATEREVPATKCSTPRLDREECNSHECTEWKFSSWSQCSVTCGKGVHTRTATCTSSSGRSLDNARCDVRERIVQKPCEKASCPGWKTSDWSECSVSCQDGWQTRRVECVDQSGLSRPESICSSSPRPPSHQTCNLGLCPFWRIGEWSTCSAPCGDGHRSRIVECIHRDQTVDISFCTERQPKSEEKCKLLPCALWKTSDWSQCSVSCGVGSQERRVTCVRSSHTLEDIHCDKSTRPRSFKRCERECNAFPNVLAHNDNKVKTPDIFWATAPWSECSKTCGDGVQKRQITCRQGEVEVSSSRCSHLERLPTTQKCTLQPCAEWKILEWNPCPVSCGQSEQTRQVICVSTYDSFLQLNDTTCNVELRPETARLCHLPECPEGRESPPGQWKSQPWTKCSVSCGGGWRRRDVSCERSHCIGTKPKMFEVCNKQSCPKEKHAWQISPWTSCSVTCGGGEQRRIVWCENVESRKKADDSQCKESKPAEQQDCQLASCGASENQSSRRGWSPGPWSACSSKCGKGERTRVISCVDLVSSLRVASTLCDPEVKPISTVSCRSRCSRWRTQPWGECSTSCGSGIHTRQVLCQKGHRSSPPKDCSHLPKPVESARCYGPPCPAYKWTTTPWSTCNHPCTKSTQHRRVYCMSSIGRRAAPRMCTSARPSLSRPCSTLKCPYHWSPTPWQACSATCGNGTQLRTLECRLKSSLSVDAVFSESSVPREKCSDLDEPEKSRQCQMVPCNATFHWDVGPWQPCSSSCGKGVSRRRVRCLHSDGRRASRHQCLQLAKRPPRAQSCFLKNCVASSCEEVRQYNSSTLDGNYTLLLDGYPIVVYCSRMKDPIPREYINVDPETNYAEVYGKRLIFPLTCPHDGLRNDSCECTDDGDSDAGITRFSKIRVDLINRKMKINDFTFSSTSHGVPVPYATAGDCYSMKECPQGRFSVDLRGTGVRIVDDLLWEDKGHRSHSRIDRRESNTLIEGLCGGYCGKCAPDKYKGLVFEAHRPS